MASMFPSTDTGLLALSLQFKTLVVASPTTYGLVTAQATAYTAFHDAYATALAAVEPGVRSKSAVTAKNVARTNLKNNFKLLAAIIQNTPSVTAAQKQALGLSVRQRPMPIPVPATAPVLTVLSVNAWTVKLKLKALNAARRGKPAGVLGAGLFTYTGVTPPNDISAWKFEGVCGRSEVDIVVDSTLASGTKMWITAMWFNGRKETGPCCNPISTLIQGGGVQSVSAQTPMALAA